MSRDVAYRNGYLPLFAGAELVRRSGALTQFPAENLIGTLPEIPGGEFRFNIPTGANGFAHDGTLYQRGDEADFVTLSSLGDIWLPSSGLPFAYVVLYKQGASIEDQPTWELTQGTATLLSWQDIVDLGAQDIAGMVPGASALAAAYPRDGVDGAAQGDLRLVADGQTFEFRSRWPTWRAEWNAFSALSVCHLSGGGINCPALTAYTLPEDFGYKGYLGDGVEMSPADTTWAPWTGGVRLCYSSVNTQLNFSMFLGANQEMYEVGWSPDGITPPAFWGPVAAAFAQTQDTTCNAIVSTESGTRVQVGDVAFNSAQVTFFIRLKGAPEGDPEATGLGSHVFVPAGFRYTAH